MTEHNVKHKGTLKGAAHGGGISTRKHEDKHFFECSCGHHWYEYLGQSQDPEEVTCPDDR